MPPAGRLGLDERLSLLAQPAPGSRDEQNRTHTGIFPSLMRPGTVLTIVLLLVALMVAAIVFVIQLLSVT